MNTFSINRAVRYGKLYIADKKRGYCRLALLFVGILLLGQLCEILIDGTLSRGVEPLGGLYAMFVSIIAAGALKAYHSPLTSPRLLMLPATKGEKFTAIAVLNVVIIPIVFAVIYYLEMNIMYQLNDFGSQWMPFSDMISYPNLQIMEGGVVITNTNIWINYSFAMLSGLTSCLLCGALFRKNPFLIGCGISIVFFILVVVIGIYIAQKYSISSKQIEEFLIFAWRWFLGISPVICTYFAWRVFKNMKIKR